MPTPKKPIKKGPEPKSKAKTSASKAPEKTYSGTGKGGSLDRAPYKGKTELKPSTPARKATSMTTSQAKSFDAKKKQQRQNYLNSTDSWLDVSANPNFSKGQFLMNEPKKKKK